VSSAAALTVINGLLVLPEGKPQKGSIRCEGGKIVALGDVGATNDHPVIDAKGALIAPGLVDFGVFAIDKPAFHFGGITRAALMPDQSPVLDHPARVRFAAQSGKPDLWVHPLAAATRGLEGVELAELALMREAGAKAVATGRHWIADSGTMARLLRYAAMLGPKTAAWWAMQWQQRAKWRPGWVWLQLPKKPKPWRSHVTLRFPK
jgi:dihydroorotase